MRMIRTTAAALVFTLAASAGLERATAASCPNGGCFIVASTADCIGPNCHEPVASCVGSNCDRDAAPGTRAPAAMASAGRERFRYAYISKNVSCLETPRPVRQKYLTQVFGYCPAEVSKGQLLRDSEIDFRRAVKAECGEKYEVSFEYVSDSDGEAQADSERQREAGEALSSGDYKKVVDWHAALDYYSSRCR
jgi:hypothetical protein